MTTSPFPIVVNPKLPPKDGLLVPTPSFCHKAKRSVCEDFYNSIWNQEGFHECPFGFCTYVSASQKNYYVYSGLRIIGRCNRKQLKGRTIQKDYSPNVPETAFLDAMERITQSQMDIEKKATQARQFAEAIESLKQAIDDQQAFGSVTLHELRRLNADLKAYAEGLTAAVNSADLADLRLKSETIFATSTLISVRLDAYDLETNPEAATTGNRIVAGVYRKFDKSKRCLEVTRARERAKIYFQGSTYSNILAYPVFDLLPYVLLENAIKYTPEGETVCVDFDEIEDGLTVSVSSLGPLLENDERDQIFARGFRGKHAAKSGIHGTGIGLYLAARISEIHDLKVAAHVSGDVVDYKGVPYSSFCIEVHFPSSVMVGGSRLSRREVG